MAALGQEAQLAQRGINGCSQTTQRLQASRLDGVGGVDRADSCKLTGAPCRHASQDYDAVGGAVVHVNIQSLLYVVPVIFNSLHLCCKVRNLMPEL